MKNLKKKRSSCTTMIVGKKASIDGSIIIARNEDYYSEIDCKVFIVEPAVKKAGRIYKSENNKAEFPLPEKAYRYTSVPSAWAHTKKTEGVYGEAGINEVGVALSATESLYGNPRVLAYDPLNPDGIAEDAINDVVLPFINSAQEGVEYLGELVAKYGSAEGNGVLFADRNEAWYMEIPCGHHWAAVRIPDNCYAVAPNQSCIEEIDFSKPKDYKWSKGIKEFVEKHNLNPNPKKGFNFRKIFGTSNELDHIYNTPRAWYAQKYLTPEIEQSPTSDDIPFLQKANRLITLEDVEFVLGSHFNETEFDPLGVTNSEFDKTRFRAISLCRTSESHLLQLRPKAAKGVEAIQWLSFGTPSFTPYVPFFTNVLDTPTAYRRMTKLVSTDNAYWLFKLVGHFVEAHHSAFKRQSDTYLHEMQSYGHLRVKQITEAAKKIPAKDLPEFLTGENKQTAEFILKKTKEHLSSLMEQSFKYSKLTFNMDKNL